MKKITYIAFLVCEKLRAFFETAKQKVYSYERNHFPSMGCPVPDDVTIPKGFVAEVREGEIVFTPNCLDFNCPIPDGYKVAIHRGRIYFFSDNKENHNYGTLYSKATDGYEG